jgi:hypothetical protein
MRGKEGSEAASWSNTRGMGVWESCSVCAIIELKKYQFQVDWKLLRISLLCDIDYRDPGSYLVQ